MGAEYPTPAIDALALGGIRLNQSYVLQLCSPSRAALLSSRYSYNIGMDGNVLVSGDARCINTTAATLGDRLSRGGVRTAFVGKYDVGYSSWACTANCRGFDYWLGYYGAAEDYYLHGSKTTLDFHENFAQAPQYRGTYSTDLFVRKAIEWAQNETTSTGAGAGASTPSTLLYLSFQAVHSPIEMPPQNYSHACGHINEPTRRTYCAMMQALDCGVANVTSAYKQMGLFDDTVFLFLADNGGMNSEGGFNVPLRGQKATVWEGGVRSQTFLHWSGFAPSLQGSVYAGLAHATDWGVTLEAALLGTAAAPNPGEPALDGMNLWPALTSGGASPRTEMLLSMRDVGQCAAQYRHECTYAGQLAYRRGKYKLIYGHTALRGSHGGNECQWGPNPKTGAGPAQLNCWNGWGKPRDVGASRPPPAMPRRPGQPANSSLYSWGALFLYDIENDPLEEHELSASQPDVVRELTAALEAYIQKGISQDVEHDPGAKTEACGDGLACAAPWLPYPSGDRCKAPAPGPAPGPPPPAPGKNCCQCLKEGGGTACTETKCRRKGAACVDCIEKGGGSACRRSCGCKK